RHTHIWLGGVAAAGGVLLEDGGRDLDVGGAVLEQIEACHAAPLGDLEQGASPRRVRVALDDCEIGEDSPGHATEPIVEVVEPVDATVRRTLGAVLQFAVVVMRPAGGGEGQVEGEDGHWPLSSRSASSRYSRAIETASSRVTGSRPESRSACHSREVRRLLI